MTDLDPAVAQIVVLLEPGATAAETGAAVARFLELTEGAQESSLLVLPLDAAAAGEAAPGRGPAAIVLALDVAPYPQRLTVGSLVTSGARVRGGCRVARGGGAVPDSAGTLWNAGGSGDRFALTVEPDTDSGVEDAVAAADAVVRLLEGSGIPAEALSWQARGDAAWSGNRVLPDAARRAAAAEAAAAATAALALALPPRS